MKRRQKDRRYVRYVGPEDRAQGEWRGYPVEIIEACDPFWLVRFPDGTVSRVHEDHLTDAIFRGE